MLSHTVKPGSPRLPATALVGAPTGGGGGGSGGGGGGGCEELLLSVIRHELLPLFSLLTSSSAAVGSGMGWLIPSSSSWACCLLRAT